MDVNVIGDEQTTIWLAVGTNLSDAAIDAWRGDGNRSTFRGMAGLRRLALAAAFAKRDVTVASARTDLAASACCGKARN